MSSSLVRNSNMSVLLILSILSISAFAAPTPQYAPVALAAPAASQQYPSKYIAAQSAQQHHSEAPTTPAAQQYTSVDLNAPSTPYFSSGDPTVDPAAAMKNTNVAQQLKQSPYDSTASTAPASPAYICYKKLDFPNQNRWLSFDALQTRNLDTMKLGNTVETVGDIFKAILVVSSSANIDSRIVLAMVMQESSGQTFKDGDWHQSSGLMQVQPQNDEQGIRCTQNDCSSAKITGMIMQGVLGTAKGNSPVAPGIAYWLRRYKNLPMALRAYNSGQVPDKDDMSIATSISTASYVSDIGNRLMGLAPEEFLDTRISGCGFAPTPTNN
ncbi:hypothetical protein MMC07_004406 [Pseudocyphellaria aurata]|nr:hypothetical protein [Pseudocyphellaria aurata]